VAPTESALGSGSPQNLGQRVDGPARLDRAEVRRRKLLRAARRGDRGARARLVECYLPLVRSIASWYRDYGLHFDDLVQEGSIGLLDAIDHYDAGRGLGFEAYARFRVRRAIRNALTDQARLIRLPKQVVERRRMLDHAEAGLLARGLQPTPANLAAATGLSVAAVVEARMAMQAPVSIDEPILADGSSLESLLADPVASDPATDTIEREQGVLLTRALAHLPERQRRVVSARWGVNGAPERSATDLARELGLSARRTQTISNDALNALRQELELEPGRRTLRWSSERLVPDDRPV
jgi:RNA polymerase sigma factor (sigma-70 family)